MAGGVQSTSETGTGAGDFTARLVDQFFRRWFWYALPVVLLMAVGVRASQNVQEPFISSGTLSASENPLVATPEVRGTSIGQFEPPASGIARLINEQLRSDSFVEIVAERAGLAAALDSEAITLDVIRQQVSVAPQGENLLTVRASWGDAQTSYLLVDATINGYLDLLAETVAIDSVEAIDFWTGIRAEAQTRSDTAEDELRGYTTTLPELDPGERLSTAQELDLTRLNATLDAALADVRDAQDRIDTAKLNVEQSKSEAGRQVRVVDPPRPANAATPETFKKITTTFMFTLIGLLISGVALAVTTALDHSIRSLAQLQSASGMTSAAIVPRSKPLRDWLQSRTRLAS